MPLFLTRRRFLCRGCTLASLSIVRQSLIKYRQFVFWQPDSLVLQSDHMSNRKAAMGFIFVTLLVDVTGFGVIIPVIPKLISDLGHVGLPEASSYGGWLLAAFAIMQFLCSPLVGNLSDQYGRRPVLLASLFGFGIDYLFLVFAPTIGWLFVGRIIAGIMGASFTTAAAYIADISPPERGRKISE